MSNGPAPRPSRPLRVLFVNENLGGHATLHHHLELALAENHPEVSPTFFHLPPPGFFRRVVGAQIPGLAGLDLDLQPLRALLAQSVITHKFLRAHAGDFDVIHVYTHNAALVSSSLLAERPSVVSLDTTNALNAYRLLHRTPTRWTPRVLPPLQAFERRVYRAAAFVVANSEWAARSLRDDYDLSPPKLQVFPAGIMPPADRGESAPEQRGDNPPRVTFIGRELERKGGMQLVEGWRKVLKQRCTLTLVTYDRLPPEDGLEVRTDVRPGDGKVWDILAATDVFVLPSAVDQAPNCVLEAMAMGVPVVASATGAVPEMVEHGVSGFVPDIGDDEAVIDAIRQLLDDPGLRREMGNAGRARFLERYDARRTAASLVGVLRSAAEMG